MQSMYLGKNSVHNLGNLWYRNQRLNDFPVINRSRLLQSKIKIDIHYKRGK